MAGFNKKGPQNKGPMTGGKKGFCVSDKNEAQELNTDGEKISVGRGQGLQRGEGTRFGRCGDRHGGRGFCQGGGRGRKR